ncbi:MAG: hypothetical protein ACTSSI_09390 [Candidatus Helarchaeota archaeon]
MSRHRVRATFILFLFIFCSFIFFSTILLVPEEMPLVTTRFISSSALPSSRAFQVGFGDIVSYSPDISVNSSGHVQACWLDERGLHHGVKSDSGFTTQSTLIYNITEEFINGSLYLSHARILIDDQDTVHVCVVEQNYLSSIRTLRHFYRFKNNDTWFNCTVASSLIHARWTDENYGFWATNNLSYFSYVKSAGLYVEYRLVAHNLTAETLSDKLIYSIDMFTYLQQGSFTETWLLPQGNVFSYIYIKMTGVKPPQLVSLTYTDNLTLIVSNDIMETTTCDHFIDIERGESGHLFIANAPSLDLDNFTIYTWSGDSGIESFYLIKDSRNQLRPLQAQLHADDIGGIHVTYPTWNIINIDWLLQGSFLTYLHHDPILNSWQVPRILYFPALNDPRAVRFCVYNDTVHWIWQDGDLWDSAEYQQGNQVYYTNSSYLLSEFDFATIKYPPLLLPFSEMIQYSVLIIAGIILGFYLMNQLKKRPKFQENKFRRK